MTNVVRIALPGFNALTDTDARHYSVFSDEDNILIKEFARGTGLISDGSTVTILHNLGYVPFVLVMGRQVGGTTTPWTLCSAGQSEAGTLETCDVDTENLYIRDNSNGFGGEYKYYIFYDRQV